MTTSGGLHFDDPSAAADYYSNGGHQQQFPSKTRPDSDPLTVAQVRLYLPPGVYDPEADPRPEFMTNHIGNSSGSGGKTSSKGTADSGVADDNKSSSAIASRRRRRRHSTSSSHDNDETGDDYKRQRKPRKRQHKRRQNKLYPMLVVVNSDPGSQAITDRFTDRLGYTTGLLCSGSSGGMLPGTGGSGGRHDDNEWNQRRQRGHRNRRSSATRYYSSGRSEDYDDDSYDYDMNGDDIGDDGYVVAVVDPGKGTWGRGYESLLALNYGDSDGGNGSDSGDGIDGLLGTADLRDQLEAVEYLLSSAAGDSKSGGQGYYSDDRHRAGRSGRDHSRWFSSTSQSNRRYYSDDDDDDDYYGNEEYDENNNYGNEDYYYYYYSNGGDNSDYGGGYRKNDDYKDGENKRSRRASRSTSGAKTSTDTLQLPYVDATRVALLGGGPTSPSTPPSIYGGYAAARIALWQTKNGGAPMERSGGETGGSGNRKVPVSIPSSFKCAISMAPVFSWRLYGKLIFCRDLRTLITSLICDARMLQLQHLPKDTMDFLMEMMQILGHHTINRI